MSHTHAANQLREQSFNEVERQIVVGCLLGDGTLSQAGKNYRLRVEHKAAHWDYVQWKFQRLQRFCLTEPQAVSQHRSYRFGTVGHPELTKLRSMFYDERGIKGIPTGLREQVGPLGLAVWFMDDGGRVHETVSLSVHSYSRSEVTALQSLWAEWGVRVHIHWDGHGHRLYVPTGEYGTFKRLVKPYVDEVPCMAGKLP
jgi:hypothetical protein